MSTIYKNIIFTIDLILVLAESWAVITVPASNDITICSVKCKTLVHSIQKNETLYTLHPWVSIFNRLICNTTMSALFFFCRLLHSFTVALPTSLHILESVLSTTSHTQCPFLCHSHSLTQSSEWHARITAQPKVTQILCD